MSQLDVYNYNVSRWATDTKRATKIALARKSRNYSGHGQQDQKVKVGKYAGEASKISFSFPYYLVFVHKGAGRGYGGSITGSYTKKDGSKGKTNPASFGKMGTGKRQPNPWFNPVIEERFPILADLIAEYHGGDKVFAQVQKILIR